jgi:pimeloyl-ACP methyl ester carboxylesterase
MTLIHHVVDGSGTPPIVFVHGFSCDHTDWAAQVSHFAPRHKTVAVDLRGHGRTPGDGPDCSIDVYGRDVADVMRALDLKNAILVGHSMGCRVVIEAASEAPERTAGVVLVDGSQFNQATRDLIGPAVAAGKYPALVAAMFGQMFNERSDPARRQAILDRSAAFKRAVGEKMTLDSIRYDMTTLEPRLRALAAPLLVIQSTFTNPERNRLPLARGQDTPYFQMLRTNVPTVAIEIVESTGHFTQVDAPEETNALIASFISARA